MRHGRDPRRKENTVNGRSHLLLVGALISMTVAGCQRESPTLQEPEDACHALGAQIAACFGIHDLDQSKALSDQLRANAKTQQGLDACEANRKLLDQQCPRGVK